MSRTPTLTSEEIKLLLNAKGNYVRLQGKAGAGCNTI